MNPLVKELAEKMDGTEHRGEPTPDMARQAKENGIVIVFGASDDLIEFRGAINDEAGAYNGGTVYVNDSGLIAEPDCDCEYAQKWHKQQKASAEKIEAVWCGKDGDGNETSWTYKTDIPHETFRILEDGEIYCVGIVFEMKI